MTFQIPPNACFDSQQLGTIALKLSNLPETPEHDQKRLNLLNMFAGTLNSMAAQESNSKNIDLAARLSNKMIEVDAQIADLQQRMAALGAFKKKPA